MNETMGDDRGRLIAFLADRDVACPLCGYNLRNLTSEQCPECRHELRLAVGLQRVRVGWLLATVAPGIFSGIAGALLAIVIVAVPATGGGKAAPGLYLMSMLGLGSGMVTLAPIVWRYRFIRLRPRAQRAWAMVSWGIHGLAFLGFVLLVVLTA